MSGVQLEAIDFDYYNFFEKFNHIKNNNFLNINFPEKNIANIHNKKIANLFNCKCIITMTCWLKRIFILNEFLNSFLSNQTMLPNMFYIFLSKSEFPLQENSLPDDLVETIKKYNINLIWLDNNEYCHKRWYVYPKHWNDLVISIDEDIIFKNNLIENSLQYVNNTGNIYNLFRNITYHSDFLNSIKNELIPGGINSIKPDIKNTFLGTCIIPPRTFPIEALTLKNIKLREKFCKKCDESWLNPFIKFNNIKIGAIDEIKPINPGKDDIEPLCDEMDKYYFEKKCRTRDIQVYIVLRLFPELLNCWKKIFPNYNDKLFDNLMIDDIYKMINN